MTIVARGPGLIACSFVDETVKVSEPGRRTVFFEFSEMFGPTFLDHRGEPLKRQPMPGSRHWGAFEHWHTHIHKGGGRNAVTVSAGEVTK